MIFSTIRVMSERTTLVEVELVELLIIVGLTYAFLAWIFGALAVRKIAGEIPIGDIRRLDLALFWLLSPATLPALAVYEAGKCSGRFLTWGLTAISKLIIPVPKSHSLIVVEPPRWEQN